MTKQLSPKTLSAHINRLISRWPSDPVRPSAVSVQTYLKTRLPTTPTPTTSSSSSPSPPTATATAPQSQAQAQAQAQQQQQQSQLSTASINALYSLLENRYEKQYPLPQNLRHPRSAPSHYDDVLREFREAPGRGWVKRMMEKLRGVLRFQ
ncbi:hypothetical protein RJ035_004823 [Blastomyces gilchristii]|uniref:Uncharacterized protein n=1 Tax=Ajellomyces dermatitidis (strain ATCC 18188 / CBS 674.68) TaxID=653446 RepID=F2TP52_AJEDA|nr:hypothetical protein BDDG_07960 [Blastomyces dermatitidis ATCC 18188]EQL34027.1 hypothetical protein BDFG_03952 [Blastomyces dermatitidis ATCC 26199]